MNVVSILRRLRAYAGAVCLHDTIAPADKAVILAECRQQAQRLVPLVAGHQVPQVESIARYLDALCDHVGDQTGPAADVGSARVGIRSPSAM